MPSTAATFGFVLAAGAAVVAAILLPPWWRARSFRKRLISGALDDERKRIRSTRAWVRLSEALRPILETRALKLLDSVSFIGCGGFEVTPDVRVEIATQACLPVLRAPLDVYALLRTFLVYPDEFRVMEIFEEDGVVTERESMLSGQAFDASRIVLSWRDVTEAGAGYNVVIHECAHHLDHVAPPDVGPDAAGWSRAVAIARDDLERRLQSGADDPLDDYALEHPEEFFAVASETFFESPGPLLATHPELYAALARYYAVDPVTWDDGNRPSVD